METARAMGVPVAATPLVNYLAVAEHNWALILDYLKRMPQHRRFMQERAYVQEADEPSKSEIILACDQTLGYSAWARLPVRWRATRRHSA